jgi:hypothetical protein
MHFLYPNFLYALFLIAIPVIIHLFNFRRYKKIVFSDIRFLKQLTEQNKKQQTIKNWLILLARILMITFLVLAFAQPFIPQKEVAFKDGRYWVSIYVDNSFSMEAKGKDGSLLDQAKKKAEQIANSYKESDQFQLLTNDFEGKHQRLVNRKDFLQMLEEVSISPAHKNIAQIKARQNALNQQAGIGAGLYYWLSDFQKNMDVQKWVNDSSNNTFLVPLQSNQSQNVWIDSAWFPDPLLKVGGQNKIKFVIKNASETNFESQALVLKLDGVQKAIQNVNCPAGEKVEAEINFSLNDYNWHGLGLSLTDFPIVFDDNYYLAAKAKEYVNVMLVNDNETEGNISKVYSLDPFYHLKTVNIRQLNFAEFAAQAVIILNEPASLGSGLTQELIKFIKGGGTLFFIPSNSPVDVNSIQNFLVQTGINISGFQKQTLAVNTIETKDPIFDKVFTKVPELANLPVISQYWQLSGLSSNYRKIMNLANDFPFLVRSKLGAGNCYALASSLNKNSSNFSQNPLFVPLLLNLPLQTKHKFHSSFTLSEQSTFSFEAKEIQKVLSLNLGKQEHLVEVQMKDGNGFGRLNGQLKNAGVYKLQNASDVWAQIAFNYPRNESEPGFIDPKELAIKINASALDKDISLLKNKIYQEINGKQYWLYALCLALLFLLLEAALIIKWK